MAAAALLIADDNAERAQALHERLTCDAWSVSIAPSVAAAKAAIGANPISVVLADAGLWHEGGLGAFTSAEHPALPVIVLTAPDEASPSLVQHLKLGAMTYIPRDVGRRRLAETIESLLAVTSHNPFRERIKSFLRAAEIELEIGNDPGTIAVVVGYLQRVLEDYGLSNARDRFRVGLALSEALSNAMIHGNLEVPSDLREEGAEGYYEMIDRQRSAEPFASRTVQAKARFSESTATFIIRDQGGGFDRGAIPDPTDPANLMRKSGRGILLMRTYADLVSWNEAGNEVTLVKKLTE